MRTTIVMVISFIAVTVFACNGTSTATFEAGVADGSDGTDSNIVPSGTFTDFGDPIVVTGDGGVSAPSDSQTLFGGTSGTQSGGPCLVEPEINSLFPRNWLRPRFRWTASGGENLFELRVQAP